jgi:hypothetical protein
MDKYTYPHLTISEVFESSRGVLMGRFWVLELIPDFALSCQKHRYKHLDFQYRYPISYKNAKKAKHVKWICPIEKRYHNH